jgi:hypothetical protein
LQKNRGCRPVDQNALQRLPDRFSGLVEKQSRVVPPARQPGMRSDARPWLERSDDPQPRAAPPSGGRGLVFETSATRRFYPTKCFSRRSDSDATTCSEDRTVGRQSFFATLSPGLIVEAALDTHPDDTEIKVSDKELAELRLQWHEFHGAWNSMIAPRRKKL